MDQFTDLKPAWHAQRILDLRAKKDVVPTHVQLIISDLCNQDCHFCAYRMEGGFSTEKFPDAEGNKNPNRRMPTDKALEIVRDCHYLGVGAIQFTGGGEPTVHPDWADIIGEAQRLGLETGLVTNGILLREKHRNILRALKWLRISLDAGTAETYSRIRRSDKFQKALDAIELGASLGGPYVGVGFVITRENFHEIAQATKAAKQYGAPYIRLSAMFSNFGAEYYRGIEGQINSQRMLAKQNEDDTFRVVDFFDNRVKDLEMAQPDYSFCGFQQFTLYIGGDQKVYTCCTNAYTTHGEIGDLRKTSFKDWLSTHRRYDFNARSCHHCQFNDKNKLINYLVSEPPHVNFV